MALINAKVKYKEQNITIDMPKDSFYIYSMLQTIDIRQYPDKLHLSDNESENIQIELSSDNDMGSHLIKLFDENQTLSDINSVAIAVSNTHEVIRDDLEQSILYDPYDNANELLKDISSLTDNACTVRETYYFPLTGTIYDAEEYEPYEIGNRFLADNEDKISEAIEQYINSDDYNMAYYYDEKGQEKLLSADWGLAYIDGTLYGKVDIRLTEAMTAEETEALKDWISGQNSDGAGEGFEQKDIETDEGTLNVSFWNSSDDYFIYDQEEMDEYIKQQGNMRMGVM